MYYMDKDNQHRHPRLSGPMLACLLALSLLATPLQAQQAAAKVQFAVGEVSAQSSDGKLRRLKKGDRIYPGDTIKTGERGSAQLIYRDRSRMAVRVNTEFKINKYQYDDQDKKGAVSFFSLLRGALRSVSGLIGSSNPQNVTIDTPLATIGIRGTDHEVVHILQPAGGARPIAKVGTYNKVYKGGTIMKTVRGNLELDLHQVGYVGAAQGGVVKPVKLKRLPAAINKQLINKIPMQAKTQPQADEKALAGGKKSSKKSSATSGKGGGAAKNAGKNGDSSNRASSKIPAVTKANSGNRAGVNAPNVSIVPGAGGPVPIPYPATGKSAPKTGSKGSSVKSLQQPLKKSKAYKSNGSLPAVIDAPKVKIPNAVAPRTAIPVTVAPTAKIPVKVSPKVSIPTKVAPKVSIPVKVSPKVSIKAKTKAAPRIAAPIKKTAPKKKLK